MPEIDQKIQKNMEKGGKRVKRGKFEKAKSMFSLPTQLNLKKQTFCSVFTRPAYC